MVRYETLRTWAAGHRGHSIVIGIAVLFIGSLVGGYWIAQRLESSDGDRLARETLEQMKKDAPPAKYASIDEIPGLPRYKETEQPVATIEEKPRTRPQVAAAAVSPQVTWKRRP